MADTKESIILEVGGFFLRINLHPTEWIYSQNKFRSELTTYYKNFISRKKVIRNDYVIDVVEQRRFSFHKKKGVGFMELFEENGKTHLTTYYQLSIIQFQLLLNNALHYLLSKKSGFVLHASASATPKGALVFLGPSGRGKSTIMQLIDKTYPALGDDSIIVRKMNETYYVFQTPTIEKEKWVAKSSRPFPLRVFYFLEKKRNKFHMAKLNSKNKILELLMKQILTNTQSTRQTIAVLLDLLKRQDYFYTLEFLKHETKLIEYLSRAQNSEYPQQ